MPNTRRLQSAHQDNRDVEMKSILAAVAIYAAAFANPASAMTLTEMEITMVGTLLAYNKHCEPLPEATQAAVIRSIRKIGDPEAIDKAALEAVERMRQSGRERWCEIGRKLGVDTLKGPSAEYFK
jgi:hypothetical protein